MVLDAAAKRIARCDCCEYGIPCSLQCKKPPRKRQPWPFFFIVPPQHQLAASTASSRIPVDQRLSDRRPRDLLLLAYFRKLPLSRSSPREICRTRAAAEEASWWISDICSPLFPHGTLSSRSENLTAAHRSTGFGNQQNLTSPPAERPHPSNQNTNWA